MKSEPCEFVKPVKGSKKIRRCIYAEKGREKTGIRELAKLS
jgi:hypothetical protein